MPIKELVLVCAGGIKGVLDVQEKDTLADVRIQIDEELDDDLIVSDFAFHVDDVRISQKQERKKLAWLVLDKRVSIQAKRSRPLDLDDATIIISPSAKKLKVAYCDNATQEITPQSSLRGRGGDANNERSETPGDSDAANRNPGSNMLAEADTTMQSNPKRLKDLFDQAILDARSKVQNSSDKDSGAEAGAGDDIVESASPSEGIIDPNPGPVSNGTDSTSTAKKADVAIEGKTTDQGDDAGDDIIKSAEAKIDSTPESESKETDSTSACADKADVEMESKKTDQDDDNATTHNLVTAFVRENAESTLWWPAIVGDSYSEVIQSFGPGDNQEKAKFTTGWFNDKSSMSCTKLARLVNHRMHPSKIMHLCIVEGMESILIKDFYEHMGDTELLRKARDNEGCSNAIKQALEWVSGDSGESDSSILSSPGGTYCNFDGPLSPNCSTGQFSQKKSASESQVSNVLQTKPSANDSVDNDCKMPASNASYEDNVLVCSTPATPPASKNNTNAAVAASNVANEKQDYSTPNTRSSTKGNTAAVVVAASQTRIDGLNTSLPRHTEGKKVTPSKEKMSRSKSKVPMKNIRKNDKWEKVLNILQQNHGWEVRPGKGLIGRYFIPAELAKESTEDIKKKYKSGEDYFVNEIDVMHIARTRYGWTGPNENIPSDGEWPLVLSVIEWKLDLTWKNNNMRVKREHKSLKVSVIEATLKKDEDYFIGEESLKDYAYNHYGWRGPSGREYAPFEHGAGRRKRGTDSTCMGSNGSKSEKSKKPSKTSKSISDRKEQDTMIRASQDSKFEETENPLSIETPPTEASESALNGKEQDTMDADSQDSKSEQSEKPRSLGTPPSNLSKNIASDEEIYSEGVVPFTPVPKEGEWPTVLSKIEWNLKLTWKNDNMRVKREHAHLSISEIEATLKKDEDYFIGEESLKDYAYNHYGWRGPSGREYAPFEHGAGRRKRSMDRQEELIPAVKKTKYVSHTIIKSKYNSPKARPVRKAKKGYTIQPPVYSLKHSPKNVSLKISSQLSKQKVKQTQSSVGKSSKTRDAVKSGDNHNSANLTLKERLVRCSNSMDVSFAPNNMLFDGEDSTSAVSVVKNKILSFCKGCSDFDNKRSSGESSFLYICGRPGTGKTTIVQHCAKSLEPDLTYVFMKATDIQSSPKEVFKIIAKKIGKKCSTKNVEQIEKVLSSGTNSSPLLLIIDEIDFLLSGNKDAKSDLSTVLRWASDPKNRLAVIGISNSVGDDSAKSLHRGTKIYEEIVFAPFGAEDLKGILLKRLGDDFSVVDDKALVFASRKIANSGGDARNLLHVMSEAIAIASKSLSEEQLKDTSIIAHIVKLPHVMKASAGEKDSMINTIKGLCGNAKSVLCIAVALGEAGNAWKIVSASNLQKYCAEASTILDDWSRESFKSTIEILTDAGLIHEAEVDEFEFDETEEKRYKLGVQMEDVEIAMNKILLTEGSYYKGLVDYVKENDIEQKGCSM